ncbi:MAG: NTP transferase domain-containing protein [Candidatus Fermentibacteraceae bacterium]|nr:NTP transferase domain-containing protein [Candidatus Fermentibacteraceae bacterium]MBN2607640.1 NTP transferase domain-containing protein [Candidatus Fermentibacteraceae bacterium]
MTRSIGTERTVVPDMHAVIPVAGRGTRMRPLTWSVPKVLIRLAGNTMLGHILDELAVAGVDHVTLVTGYLGDQIVKWTTENYPGISVDHAVQEKMDGLASAISLASPMTDDGPLLVVLGDTLFSADLSKAMVDGRNMIAVSRVDDPRRFGVVVMEGDRVVRLVEKPAEPVSNLAIVGIYVFSSGRALMDATERLIGSGKRTRGEYQLTDAMQLMLDDGHDFGAFSVEGWYDCGKPETMLSTNRILLDRGRGRSSSRVEGSVILPPVSIHEDAEIVSSIVGPYVSIASGCRIEGTLISDSIVGCGTTIRNANISGSLIGDNATVSGNSARMIAGSTCEIEI